MSAVSFNEQYEVREELAQALYGRVLRVARRGGGGGGGGRDGEQDEVVAKVLDKRMMARRRTRGGATVLEDPVREAALLRLLRCGCAAPAGARHKCGGDCGQKGHPNLVASLPEGDALRDAENGLHVVLLPLLAGGDLFDLVADHGRPSEARARELFCGVLAGVARLHELGWVHRDVSLENVLLDASGAPRLIDFGLAAPLGSPSGAGRPGKPGYMAPEVWRHKARDNAPAMDVYSLGVVLHILLTGVPPYERPDRHDRRFVAIQNGRLGELLRAWGVPGVAPAAVALLSRMLAEDPAARPTMEELRAHPWVSPSSAPEPEQGAVDCLRMADISLSVPDHDLGA